jgi:trimeric autotransporter adhesin
MKIMQISIKRKTTTALSLIIFALGSFALCQQVQSATDTPDPGGSLPASNTADGQNALRSLTTGIYNSAFGFDSLLSLTDGKFCTGVGGATLLSNTGDENTAVGAGALLSNTTGVRNTANGTFALFSNITGNENTAIGDRALQNNNTVGVDNTATGAGALFSNTHGIYNTANGYHALFSNTDGGENTAVGLDALFSNDHGIENTAIGRAALESNTGDQNTAVGFQALNTTTGSNNVALGANAGSALTTGDNNIAIGHNVIGVPGESETIRIGNENITTTYIRGISGATVASGDAVLVASNGHLGTLTSSKRFKQDIRPMEKASEALFSLKPVTFRYKKEIDPAGTSQFGLVAEDVERVNPDLVTRDENGRVNSVRYDKVNAMMLNEFLKEHRKVEKQEATIMQLTKELTAVVARLKDQDAKIQKVSDQIEINKAGPGVVRNDSRK